MYNRCFIYLFFTHTVVFLQLKGCGRVVKNALVTGNIASYFLYTSHVHVQVMRLQEMIIKCLDV